MRGPGSTDNLLKGIAGLLSGSLGGALATGAMYAAAVVVLAVTALTVGRRAAPSSVAVPKK